MNKLLEMSQKLIYEIIQELGSHDVSMRDIKRLAREKYPDLSLHTYVGQRMLPMIKWGFLKRVKDRHGYLYIIISDFPESTTSG